MKRLFLVIAVVPLFGLFASRGGKKQPVERKPVVADPLIAKMNPEQQPFLQEIAKERLSPTQLDERIKNLESTSEVHSPAQRAELSLLRDMKARGDQISARKSTIGLLRTELKEGNVDVKQAIKDIAQFRESIDKDPLLTVDQKRELVVGVEDVERAAISALNEKINKEGLTTGLAKATEFITQGEALLSVSQDSGQKDFLKQVLREVYSKEMPQRMRADSAAYKKELETKRNNLSDAAKAAELFEVFLGNDAIWAGEFLTQEAAKELDRIRRDAASDFFVDLMVMLPQQRKLIQEDVEVVIPAQPKSSASAVTVKVTPEMRIRAIMEKLDALRFSQDQQKVRGHLDDLKKVTTKNDFAAVQPLASSLFEDIKIAYDYRQEVSDVERLKRAREQLRMMQELHEQLSLIKKDFADKPLPGELIGQFNQSYNALLRRIQELKDFIAKKPEMLFYPFPQGKRSVREEAKYQLIKAIKLDKMIPEDAFAALRDQYAAWFDEASKGGVPLSQKLLTAMRDVLYDKDLGLYQHREKYPQAESLLGLVEFNLADLRQMDSNIKYMFAWVLGDFGVPLDFIQLARINNDAYQSINLVLLTNAGIVSSIGAGQQLLATQPAYLTWLQRTFYSLNKHIWPIKKLVKWGKYVFAIVGFFIPGSDKIVAVIADVASAVQDILSLIGELTKIKNPDKQQYESFQKSIRTILDYEDRPILIKRIVADGKVRLTPSAIKSSLKGFFDTLAGSLANNLAYLKASDIEKIKMRHDVNVRLFDEAVKKRHELSELGMPYSRLAAEDIDKTLHAAALTGRELTAKYQDLITQGRIALYDAYGVLEQQAKRYATTQEKPADMSAAINRYEMLLTEAQDYLTLLVALKDVLDPRPESEFSQVRSDVLKHVNDLKKTVQKIVTEEEWQVFETTLKQLTSDRIEYMADQIVEWSLQAQKLAQEMKEKYPADLGQQAYGAKGEV